jgi:protein-S-isoprenylcysteine O-methyltransferase Ste14
MTSSWECGQNEVGDMKKKGRIWYKLRGMLIAPVYLFSFFNTFRESENWEIKALGLLIFLIGIMLRVWSQMHIHYRLREPRTLTTTGPYVYVRNPIYIGNTLILTGTTLISELVWLAPIMIMACIVTYSLVVRYEESHLTEKYGTPYLEYLKRVPRWLPTSIWYTSADKHRDWRFLLPSIRAEAYIFLLLILPILKDLWE